MSEKRQQRIFIVFYATMVISLLFLTSCGSSGRMFDVGTGIECDKSRCTGRYLIKWWRK